MAMNPLQTFLDRQGFVLLDGGLATEMELKGADLDDELWSAKMLIEEPEIIRLVHSAFLKAGADVIATSTYQASFQGFEARGYDRKRAIRLMQLSVDLAVLARETFWADNLNREGRLRPLVAGSIGPYGAVLHDGSEYHGDYGLSEQQLLDFHLPRMEVLHDTDIDLFAFETVPSRREAEALIRALEQFPGRLAWLSYSCRDGEHVSHGESFAECAALADQSEQIIGVGVNCTAPGHISSLLQNASGYATPRAVYPNSGETWRAQDNTWAGQSQTDWPVCDWYALGARIIGGCCRTTSEDIAAMRGRLKGCVRESRVS
jgi:homocysteine S-methyltransferase